MDLGFYGDGLKLQHGDVWMASILCIDIKEKIHLRNGIDRYYASCTLSEQEHLDCGSDSTISLCKIHHFAMAE